MTDAYSKLRSFLVARAETQGMPPPPVPVQLPESDPSDETEGDLGSAEGQSFAIEYRDSAGNTSRRRITVWGIKRGISDIPVLVAKCHERKATRSFRVDRILSCIDFDGVVYDDVSSFMAETFGMTNIKAFQESGHRSEDEWETLREKLRYRVTFLASIAHIDAVVHPKRSIYYRVQLPFSGTRERNRTICSFGRQIAQICRARRAHSSRN